ncbi:hypothetical protein KIN20_021698 [Parelaphostrongylus tenuis]|uniref:Uncharacterized protein n=1 Tax=Parelaphostrongylus tenuis TaxID=148309 RepID=A0AAD5QWC2_PARTN|nr:hypothetical protein KIN20_021698 [Parelaphostrongylus tenuis]
MHYPVYNVKLGFWCYSEFGGPPVFGGKPIFGSTAPKPTTTFGGGSGAGGAFSAFSGTKNLFGNVSSTTSSVFGGGMSNQPSSKNTLFGGAQLNKSFSTWR